MWLLWAVRDNIMVVAQKALDLTASIGGQLSFWNKLNICTNLRMSLRDYLRAIFLSNGGLQAESAGWRDTYFGRCI